MSSLYSLRYLGSIEVSKKVLVVFSFLVLVCIGREWIAGISTLSHHMRGKLPCLSLSCSKSLADAPSFALNTTLTFEIALLINLNAGSHRSNFDKCGGRGLNNRDFEISL